MNSLLPSFPITPSNNPSSAVARARDELLSEIGNAIQGFTVGSEQVACLATLAGILLVVDLRVETVRVLRKMATKAVEENVRHRAFVELFDASMVTQTVVDTANAVRRWHVHEAGAKRLISGLKKKLEDFSPESNEHKVVAEVIRVIPHIADSEHNWPFARSITKLVTDGRIDEAGAKVPGYLYHHMGPLAAAKARVENALKESLRKMPKTVTKPRHEDFTYVTPLLFVEHAKASDESPTSYS